MRAPRCRLVGALGAATLIAAAAAAQASPPPSATYDAPYTGYATTFDYSACYPQGSVCLVTGASDAKQGSYSTSASYDRTGDPDYDEEIASGTSQQNVTFSVPPGSSKITATFTWKVLRTSATAAASEGSILAESGLGASTQCGSGCTAGTARVVVREARSQDGVPALPQSSETPSTVQVTVTASGQLPRQLGLRGYTYARVSVGRSSLCTARWCVNARHDGQGTAAIEAVLEQVHVTAA